MKLVVSAALNLSVAPVPACSSFSTTATGLPLAVYFRKRPIHLRTAHAHVLAAQVLQALQKSSADSLEACILECPAGLQALVEVLRDTREEVRNEVILLLGQVRTTACCSPRMPFMWTVPHWKWGRK